MTDPIDPPIRLLLAALFVAARILDGRNNPDRKERIKESVADADELLRQVPP